MEASRERSRSFRHEGTTLRRPLFWLAGFGTLLLTGLANHTHAGDLNLRKHLLAAEHSAPHSNFVDRHGLCRKAYGDAARIELDHLPFETPRKTASVISSSHLAPHRIELD
jgi:hypothetical protein